MKIRTATAAHGKIPFKSGWRIGAGLSDECTLLSLCKVSRKLLPIWLKNYS
jgi:hypothetical protein